MKGKAHRPSSDRLSQNIAGCIMLSLPTLNAFWCSFWYFSNPTTNNYILNFIHYQHWPLIARVEERLDFFDLDRMSFTFIPLSLISSETTSLLWLFTLMLGCFIKIPLSKLRIGTNIITKKIFIVTAVVFLLMSLLNFNNSHSSNTITFQRPFASTLLICAFMFPFSFWLLLIMSVRIMVLTIDGVIFALRWGR